MDWCPLQFIAAGVGIIFDVSLLVTAFCDVSAGDSILKPSPSSSLSGLFFFS